MEITQTSIEKILRQIPAVQKALAEEDEIKRTHERNARAAIVASVAACDERIAKAEEIARQASISLGKLEAQYKEAKQADVNARSEVERARSERAAATKELLLHHGNRAVIDGAIKCKRWVQHLQDIERQALAMTYAAQRKGMVNQLAQQVLHDVAERQKSAATILLEIEQLTLCKEHPADIVSAVECLLSPLDFDWNPVAKEEVHK